MMYGEADAAAEWDHRPDGLRAPALVCAFTGWNDAGDAASSGALVRRQPRSARTRFAQIDPEEFYDFQGDAPEGQARRRATREIVWPAVEVFVARVPRAPRDLVLLGGPEPSMRWRTFSALIVDLAEALGMQLVVSLGALLADVPHSRPVAVTGSPPTRRWSNGSACTRSGYEGPTGIVGVLHAACQERGIPSASLWAASRTTSPPRPTPRPRSRCVRKLEGLVGVAVDASELETAAADYERQVALAVQSDPDVQAFVERLEQMAADEHGDERRPIPSGDRSRASSSDSCASADDDPGPRAEIRRRG